MMVFVSEVVELFIDSIAFLQMKRVVKLCNNLIATKRGEAGYNPAYKYAMIYKVLVNNGNAISKYADLDQTGNETTWGRDGFRDTGSGLVGCVCNKSDKAKGGQIFLTSNVHWIHPRVYLHWHKLHDKPVGWNAMGQIELGLLMEQLEKIVVGTREVPNGMQKIFREKPHTTWDYYFSGDLMFDCLGTNGFGATMTCCCDPLPSIVPGEYFHKKKTKSSACSNAARFLHLVVSVLRKEEYLRVLCTF
jgi:hypothetical protein